MKLSLLQENLNTALNTVSRFVSAKSQLPILNNILLSTDQGRLKLSATNLELGINYWLGAKIDTEGSLTIPSKEITEFVSYLSPGRLDLDLNDKNLFSISSTKVESTFATMAAVDYPQLPSINTTNFFEIDSSLLIDTISQIAFSAATDDSRPVLTAIMCQFTPDHILFVATDGFRLSLKQLKLVNPLNLNGKEALTFLIPARSLTEVSKLAKKGQLIKIGLSEDEHQLIFVLDDIELVFPPYRRGLSGLMGVLFPKVIPPKFILIVPNFINQLKSLQFLLGNPPMLLNFPLNQMLWNFLLMLLKSAKIKLQLKLK